MRAVNTYLCNLQQYAAYLQRKLRESNINATAWSQMQQAMQDRVTFTQSLMRLPAPAPNRGELQRVDVIATTIPMAVVGMDLEIHSRDRTDSGGSTPRNSHSSFSS